MALFPQFILLLLTPVFAAENITQCVQEITRMRESLPLVLNPNPDNYTQMYIYSGLKFNDMGNYKKCEDMQNARYTAIVLAPTLMASICAPKICSKEGIVAALTFAEPQLTASLQAESLTDAIHFSKEEYDDCCSEYSSGALAMMGFIAVIGCIAIVATLVEVAGLCAIAPALDTMRPAGITPWRRTQPRFL